MIRLASLALPLAALATSAVALAQAGQPANAPAPAPAPSGQQLFTEKCGGCHLEGGFGTRVLARRVPAGEAKLEDRTVLPAALTIAVVRNGVGSMPQIREAELGNADLAAIAAYLEMNP